MTITRRIIPVSNYTVGRSGKKIDKIICHWFGTGTLAGADARFKNPASQVSAHYGVSGSTIYQWVEEQDTAYAAGNLEANRTGISIEVDATTEHNASDETYNTVGELIADIWNRHGKLPLRRHNEFKATQCPGTVDVSKLEAIALTYFMPEKSYEDLVKDLAATNVALLKCEEHGRYLNERVDALTSDLLRTDDLWKQAMAEIERLRKDVATSYERGVADGVKNAPPKIIEVIKEVKVPAEELTPLEHLRLALKSLFGWISK